MRRLPLLVVMILAFIGGLAPTTLAAPNHSAISSSRVASLVSGANSCMGVGSCTGATGPIGHDSCNGNGACQNTMGAIGDFSCNGSGSECQNAKGNIGNNSCVGFQVCLKAKGNIGDNACNGPNGSCHDSSGAIGHDSCNAAYSEACGVALADIGNSSCNAFVACEQIRAAVGTGSCNGEDACGNNRFTAIGDNICNAPNACHPAPAILHITVTGAGLMTGEDWSDAIAGLEEGLHESVSGDELWVAAGTYLPPANPSFPRFCAFLLASNRSVFGGFAGTETTRSQRNWTANPTIMSGDIGAANDVSDNCYHVVQDGNNSVLDGFTVTGGNNDPISCSCPGDYGGGINTSANSTFRNLIVTGNASVYGGGIGITGSQPVFSNIIVTNNHANRGGGIAIVTGVPISITNAIVSGNLAGFGGGLDTDGATVTMINVTISGNKATSGGGLQNRNSSSLTLRNAIVWGNNASQLLNTLSGTAIVDHSDVQFGLPAGTTDGGSNIDADPMFVTPIVAAAPTVTGDLHLIAGSPAMNTGANAEVPSAITTDIDDDARILSGTVDMGADEVTIACVPGFYSASGDDHTGSCTPAGIGFYVDASGARHQTPCPSGYTTTGTASSSAAACVAKSPYARKQQAAAELQALLPTGSTGANKRLSKGIANINSSLAPWRWTDGDSLNPVFGWKVFNFERHAITWLWSGALLGDPSLSAVANDAVNQLVAADRAIVVTAIADSTDSAAIAKANAKLAKADALIALQQRSAAIYKLRAAWLALN